MHSEDNSILFVVFFHLLQENEFCECHNNPKYWDRQAFANCGPRSDATEYFILCKTLYCIIQVSRLRLKRYNNEF